MLAREVRILFRKELRQLLRGTAALSVALVVPAFLLLFPPLGKLLGTGAEARLTVPVDAVWPPGLRTLARDTNASFRLLMPLFVTLSGMVVPSAMAVHALVAEREGRTLELLVALPVRVGQVLLAKVLALLALTVPLTFGLLLVNTCILVSTGVCSVALALALFLLLACAVAFATTGSLLVSLLARDYRAASHLSGLLVVPSMFVGLGAVLLAGGPVMASLLLSALLAAGAAVSLLLTLRFVTFERLLR
ncbi:ABC transporter permease subunit [Myxococcaceae bacterium GXIMD 01537]